MPISLAAQRPKASVANAVTFDPSALLVEGTTDLQAKIFWGTLTPSPATFEVTGTYGTGAATVTIADTSGLRVGDDCSNADITGLHVASIDSATQFTLSGNPSGAATDATITVTPRIFDALLFLTKYDFSLIEGNKKVLVRQRTWLADGSLANDLDDDGVDDTAWSALGKPISDSQFKIDIDAYLAQARVARSA